MTHDYAHWHIQEYFLSQVLARGSESTQAIDSLILSVGRMDGQPHKLCSFGRAARVQHRSQPAFLLPLRPTHPEQDGNLAMLVKPANILPKYPLRPGQAPRSRSAYVIEEIHLV